MKREKKGGECKTTKESSMCGRIFIEQEGHVKDGSLLLPTPPDEENALEIFIHKILEGVVSYLPAIPVGCIS